VDEADRLKVTSLQQWSERLSPSLVRRKGAFTSIPVQQFCPLL
jgi:hypothetical protein